MRRRLGRSLSVVVAIGPDRPLFTRRGERVRPHGNRQLSHPSAHRLDLTPGTVRLQQQHVDDGTQQAQRAVHPTVVVTPVEHHPARRGVTGIHREQANDHPIRAVPFMSQPPCCAAAIANTQTRNSMSQPPLQQPPPQWGPYVGAGDPDVPHVEPHGTGHPPDREDGLFARVELRGLEPLTPTLPVWCATSCATAPCRPGLVCPSRAERYMAPPRHPSRGPGRVVSGPPLGERAASQRSHSRHVHPDGAVDQPLHPPVPRRHRRRRRRPPKVRLWRPPKARFRRRGGGGVGAEHPGQPVAQRAVHQRRASTKVAATADPIHLTAARPLHHEGQQAEDRQRQEHAHHVGRVQSTFIPGSARTTGRRPRPGGDARSVPVRRRSS